MLARSSSEMIGRTYVSSLVRLKDFTRFLTQPLKISTKIQHTAGGTNADKSGAD
jgi:hypothetical protein